MFLCFLGKLTDSQLLLAFGNALISAVKEFELSYRNFLAIKISFKLSCFFPHNAKTLDAYMAWLERTFFGRELKAEPQFRQNSRKYFEVLMNDFKAKKTVFDREEFHELLKNRSFPMFKE